ncbi:amidase [Schizosaccharomyces japonicus yFS275]|uniref:Amidase n=1 Tax=Schizosaccharomyces japonicus (strain yFS275 / FY16936) TaxID=402676 RepID=B6JZE9_SCHJY|nr:amidase [Schizosaccharomyces japonicus yFS275]EEB06917.1 amidase [Schizosaccharomyces japonicus yFS275]
MYYMKEYERPLLSENCFLELALFNDEQQYSIDELQHFLNTGAITTVQLTRKYLEKIEKLNSRVKAFAEVNPDAVKIAKQLDEERANGHVRGPMHSIPVVVKDNMATADANTTMAGSLSLAGSVVPRDAHVVKLLRDAGAVILGHAAMSEWADMRSSRFMEGYSARSGQTLNPYCKGGCPGGSSSGSAAAVTCDMATIALGTETDGSIVTPAALNFIVGIKPTVGLTSRAGVVPESEHLDSVGTFGRTMKDAVYALDAIVGVDEMDPYTLASIGKTPRKCKYTSYLSGKSALKGLRLGFLWDDMWLRLPDEHLTNATKLIETLRQAGTTVYTDVHLKHAEDLPPSWNWDHQGVRGEPEKSEFTVVKVDFYNNINKYLKELKCSKVRSLDDVILFNYEHNEEEGGFPDSHPQFLSGQDGLIQAANAKGVKDDVYEKALKYIHWISREEGIDDALRHWDSDAGEYIMLDALVLPPHHGPSTHILAMSGYPAVIVPFGISSTNIPYGIALSSGAWQEPHLIRIASAIEDLLQARKPPRL